MRPGDAAPNLAPGCSPEAFREAFRNQLGRFQWLFGVEMRRYGKPFGRRSALLSSALSFAEGLILCPTEEAAQSHVRRDLEGARVIYIIGGDVGRAIEKGYVRFAAQAARDQTPFFALAWTALAQIQAMIDRMGDVRL